MYIRQVTFISFEEIIQFQPQTKLEMIFSTLDVSKLANALRKSNDSRGPKGYEPASLIYSLIAMQVERMKVVKDLVRNLKQNPVLRYCCGFDVLGEVPSEATFSRFLAKLTESKELEDLFYSLVKEAKELNIVDGTTVAIDSTKLDAFEAPIPKSKIIDDGTNPNWGKKKDTHGNDVKWFGWKLHILCDVKSELPLDILITPANVYDGTQAIPLIEQFTKNYKNIIHPLHYVMDSGYDFENTYKEIVSKYNGLPIIAYNPRGSYAPPEGLDENFDPVCSAGYKLIYWGKDGDYLKFRCPHAVGRCDCPYGMIWCSTSNYGYTLKLNYKEDPRHHGYPLRSSIEWKKLYDSRTAVERCNSRLKEYLSTDNIRSRGIKKAKVYALLNWIALVAGTIALNTGKQIKQAA